MSIDIFVQRAEADLRGDDIIDALITSIPVALERGRNELDQQASALMDIDVETVYRTGVRLGDLAMFLDFSTGLNWRGKITGIVHSIDNGTVTTHLQVVKPTRLEQ